MSFLLNQRNKSGKPDLRGLSPDGRTVICKAGTGLSPLQGRCVDLTADIKVMPRDACVLLLRMRLLSDLRHWAFFGAVVNPPTQRPASCDQRSFPRVTPACDPEQSRTPRRSPRSLAPNQDSVHGAPQGAGHPSSP